MKSFFRQLRSGFHNAYYQVTVAYMALMLTLILIAVLFDIRVGH